MSDSDSPTRSSWRPQFSLLTGLLLTSIAATSVVIWQLYRELVPLRLEVRNLRTQLGVLTVEKDERIHVVEVKEPGSFQWNWRVWLPGGHDFWLCASKRVPPDGVLDTPPTRFRLGVGGRELNIRVRLAPNENGDRTIYVQSANIDAPIFEVERAKWVRGETMLSVNVTGRESQESFEVNEPVVLLRLREVSSASDPSNGLLIWITNRRFTK
jgi:hypothetical protein